MTSVSAAGWLERARRVMPGGAPGFHRLFDDDYPIFAARAEGPWLFDTDERRYLDFVLGKGPVILGHGHPAVTDAVVAAIRRSPMLGLTSPVAIDAAEILLEDFTPGHRLRFHKSGSEACASAVRIARARTTRTVVLSCGYHGWHDWCSPDSPGVPAMPGFVDFRYDLDRLSGLLSINRGDVAAIIVEPQPGYLADGFYAEVAAMAERDGALFILDEVKSSFRVGGDLVANALAAPPDLVVLGKAISNGFCVSCVVGASGLMEMSDRLHMATTYDFETGPLAAIVATVGQLRDGNVAAVLNERAAALVDKLNTVFDKHDTAARAFATGAGFRLGFLDADVETAFYRAAWKSGILLYPFDNQFLSLAHGSEELDHFVEAVDTALAGIGRGPHHTHRAEAIDRPLHAFPNRKGFLAGAPGPKGRCEQILSPQRQFS